jgi:hypothetical protein
MSEYADPMYSGMSQLELFFKFGEDIRIEENGSKITITGKFKVDPSGWIGSYGSYND